MVKGTVIVISSFFPSNDGNVRNTTVPWKLSSDQKCGRYCRCSRFKTIKL